MEPSQKQNVKMKPRRRLSQRSLSCGSRMIVVVILGILVILTGCCQLCPPKPCKPSSNLILLDSHGQNIDGIVVGQTLNVGLTDLEPDRSCRAELTDEQNQIVSFYQLTSNRNGIIEPEALW